MRFYVAAGAAVIALIIGLTAIFGSWYTVDQGEEAVILRNGAIIDTVGPGLHFKLPFIDDAVSISLQLHTAVYDNMESYSRDQQPANVKISVSYHVPPNQGNEVYGEYGSIDGMIDRLVSRRLPAIFKNVFGQYDAVGAIQQRAKLNSDVLTALQTGITGPIIIDSVQIEDISFSPAYQAGIEAKQLATVEVQKRQQELAQQQVQAQITVTQAQAQADSVLAAAKAQAEATKLKGEAEAYAVEVMGKALTNNPNVVALTLAQKWDGVLPSTMIPGDTVPFIDLSPAAVAK
jgi:regulator of protease activity HflC (stomatin/prohibitin superfamily)